MAMPSYDLFTVGQSNTAAERFIALLQNSGVSAVADVRSIPASRRFTWFSKSNLTISLGEQDIAYNTMGGALGGRPRNNRLYSGGVTDYEAMAIEPEAQTGLRQLMDMTACSRVCVMCAEREPLDCHRCLLVARSLAERGLVIGHILHDGTVEAHTATEQRLLALDGGDRDLFAAGQGERLAAAYRHRARAVAFRQKVRAARGIPEDG
jgi:uncharacterized protein (DUF488 family)